MQRIGLIGGMSWESTAEYYRLLNRLVGDRLGGLHSAELVLASVDFAAVEAMQAEGRWDDAGALLAREAAALQAAGADFLVLCTNTMHKVAEQIEAAVDIDLLHLGDATAEAVLHAGVRRVGLLGTRFTMEEDFYRDRISGHGLDVVVPGDEDRAMVNRVIYDELCLGVVNEESRAAYDRVIGSLADAGCEGVILGCTEIELLVDPSAPSAVTLFPTTRLHCEAAVSRALEEPGGARAVSEGGSAGSRSPLSHRSAPVDGVSGLVLPIDPHGSVPPFEQVREGIAAQVDDGTLSPGFRLPPVRALATSLGLAPNTVARAYKELEAAGVVETRGRAGTFVAGRGAERAARSAASTYVSAARALGLSDEDIVEHLRRALG